MALPHSKNIFDYPARFQFGQAGAPCGGSSCCTDTVIQMIVEFYKEKTYSLSYIRKVAQSETSYNEAPCTGINSVEVGVALRKLGVTHYKVANGVDHLFVAKKIETGPVLVGIHYGSYPSAYNKCHSGRHGAEYHGKTDCGFRGTHAVLAIGKRAHRDVAGKYLHTDIYTRDPDHNSASRQEKPNFDRIRLSDLALAMKNLPKYTAFKNTYCIYPTQKK